jgi:hypothetical protein
MWNLKFLPGTITSPFHVEKGGGPHLKDFMTAASVGAKIVKGPAPFKASTRPAASSAVSNIDKEPAVCAVSTILVGCVVHH